MLLVEYINLLVIINLVIKSHRNYYTKIMEPCKVMNQMDMSIKMRIEEDFFFLNCIKDVAFEASESASPPTASQKSQKSD